MMTLREDVVKEQIHGGERLASLGFADAIDAGRSKTAMCGVTRSIAQLPSTYTTLLSGMHVPLQVISDAELPFPCIAFLSQLSTFCC